MKITIVFVLLIILVLLLVGAANADEVRVTPTSPPEWLETLMVTLTPSATPTPYLTPTPVAYPAPEENSYNWFHIFISLIFS